MKKITLIYITYVLLVSCAGQVKQENEVIKQEPISVKQKNDWTEMNLKGKVKSIKENWYEAIEKFGEFKKGKFIVYSNTYIFNTNGNITQEIKNENPYNFEGGHTFKSSYNYDNNENKIEQNVYHEKGGLKNKYIYKYDNNKNKIEESFYDYDGSLKDKSTYKYDNNGNKIEKESGTLKYTYKYDNKGNNIEENGFLQNGNSYFKYTYKYDDKGNKTENTMYNSNGTLIYKYIYKYDYDKNLNWIKEFKEARENFILEREIEYY